MDISAGTNSVTAPFGGTLLYSISVIQQMADLADSQTDELVVYCYSGSNETGTSDPEMYNFLVISVDGSSYQAFIEVVGTPVGEIGALVFAGLAAIGLMWLQFRWRSRRPRPGPTRAM